MADSPSVAGGHEGHDGHDGHEGHDGHDGHDPEFIAALLDRDLPDADRIVGVERVAACPSCAALHADLMALAKASQELPTPARPRDFTLPSDVAATLVQRTAGEPVPVDARLIGEMTDSRSRRAVHDRLLIANLVDRSVSDSERARGEEQMAACRDCALLYDDLVALSAATRALPVPSRPRDFALKPADAERLRVRGWRRVLAAIGSPRDVFSRPLAVGLTTLGLAGLLVATIPGALTGQASSPERLSTVGNAVDDAAGGADANPKFMLDQASAAPSAQVDLGPAAAAAAPSPGTSGTAAPEPAPSAESGYERQVPDVLFQGGESSPPAGEPDGRDLSRANPSSDEAFGGSAMVVVAGLLLLLGLGLFGLRWAARRLRAG